MSLRLSEKVAITSKIQKASFSEEKAHMILALVDNPLFSPNTPFIEFENSTDFGVMFGTNTTEFQQVNKYFSHLSKTGLAPDKVVIVNWFKNGVASKIIGDKAPELATLIALTNASFTLKVNGTDEVIDNLDFSSATSYSEIATVIQTALVSEFTNATCVYNTQSKSFIATVGTIQENQTLTLEEDNDKIFGTKPQVSNSVVAETFKDLCDRIYHSNCSGFAITTLETLLIQDVYDSVEWLQTVNRGQTYNSMLKLVFNFNDLDTIEEIQEHLKELNYTGYSMCYDPNNEYINVLDCSIGASVDFSSPAGAINFDFQPANGYTSITEYGNVVDYQNGDINSTVYHKLKDMKVNFVYSLGVGNQKKIIYGCGLENGDFGREDTQLNENWIEKQLQVQVVNAFITLNKIALQGDDAEDTLTGLIANVMESNKSNGIIARNGTLTETSKLSIIQATGVQEAPSAVESNGYYFCIKSIDVENQRANVVCCYLESGVLSEVRVINNIYGE